MATNQRKRGAALRSSMRLLICAQAVDKNDPALGFFHRWIEELASHFERITVVCLRSGEHALPDNVEIVTLGGHLRFLRALEVCSFAFGRRSEYEAVFVHMSQEYVLAAGWLWKLLGKRIYMWRNHYAGSVLTDIAAAFCTKVFCTSRFSYTAKYKKSVRMPVGIDTKVFKPLPEIARRPRSILFFARIAPSKRPELLLEALGVLGKRDVQYTATLCGPGESSYVESLRRKAHALGIGERLQFLPGLPHSEAPRIFNAHELFVNLSPSGMFDKTIFEAMACGCTLLVRSKDLQPLLDERSFCATDKVEDVADAIERLLQLGEGEKRRIVGQNRGIVAENSLDTLRERIVYELKQ